jgi:hypothetical protein|tara:strand:- start:22600 stop:22893 length:294 start_codon:yes stop_codon:yes gene_type:complete
MKFNRNTLLVILSVVAIGFLIRRTVLSCYQPRPIEIEPINEDSLHDLEHKLECTPGHTAEGSTYTKALTPGGLCKSEQLVRDQASYAIVDGIGGSLI